IPRLRKEGIPFAAVEIEELGETQIVRDLLALTRALLHPADRLAWLAVLHAPWCGLERGELEALCGGEKAACIAHLLEGNHSGLGTEAQGRLARVRAVMHAAQAERGRKPLAQLVEGAWIALGGPACIERPAHSNADAYFKALAELDHGGDISDWGRV